MVDPVDVFEGGVLDLVEVAPWSFVADQFCFVQADHGFGQGVDAPIVKSLGLGGCVLSGFVVGHDALVDLAGEEAFQAADDGFFWRGLRWYDV